VIRIAPDDAPRQTDDTPRGVVDQIARLLQNVAELLRLRGTLAKAEVNRAVRRALFGAGLMVAASIVPTPSCSTRTRSPPRPRMTGRLAPGPK